MAGLGAGYNMTQYGQYGVPGGGGAGTAPAFGRGGAGYPPQMFGGGGAGYPQQMQGGYPQQMQGGLGGYPQQMPGGGGAGTAPMYGRGGAGYPPQAMGAQRPMGAQTPMGASGPAGGGGGGGGGGMPNPYMDAGGAIAGMFGGNPYDAASDKYDQYYQQGQGYLNPYMQYGQQGLSNWYNSLQGMQDPTKYYNQIMGQYQQSPGMQFQLQQGQQAINNAMSASGGIGSGAQNEALMKYSQGLGNQDMQQYLQNIMGIQGQYQSGQQGISGMGLSASEQANKAAMQAAQDQASLSYDKSKYNTDMWGNVIGTGLEIAAM